ncbi:MAG: DUF1003 domain-containing protein [Saprospiraceae bacterium]|nr:DUF1003 domain-containing protein [Saprospiraceae bacterium]
MKASANFQHQYLEKMLHTEDQHLKKLHSLVAAALKEEDLIVRTLRLQANENSTAGQRIADKVATFGGSWTFIIGFGGVLACWIAVNVVMATRAFDPYPFILLNLVLSTIAALQAPVIMMSQNRKEEKDRKRAENDYIINLKAEIEIRNLHQKINLLMEEQFKTLLDVQKYQVELLEGIAGKKK